MTLLAAVVLALAFQAVSAPPDASKPSTFTLEGYASEVEHKLQATPKFEPETERLRPVARVSFKAPLTGKCAIATWEVVDGKTGFEIRDVIDAVKGERHYAMVVLPGRDDLEKPPSDYKIVGFCAVIDGPNASPETMTWSQFYRVSVPPAPV